MQSQTRFANSATGMSRLFPRLRCIPSHRHRSDEDSPKLPSISGCVAALALVFTSCSAWSQQPQASSIQEIQRSPLPAPSQRIMMFTPQAVREGRAAMVGHYNPDQKLRLVLNIQPPHQADEDAFVKELVTKGSPEFHKFISQDEWNSRFAPSAQDEQAVVDWAQSVGLTVTKRFPNRLLVDVEGSVGTIETAFGVTINNYQVGDEVDFSNDRNPVIPSRLSGILSAVAGLNSIERVHRMGTSLPTVKGADYVPGPPITPLEKLELAGNPAKAPWNHALKPNASTSTAKVSKSSTGMGANDNYALDNKNGTYAMDPDNVQSSQGYDYNALQRFSGCCNVPGNSAGSPPESSIALVGFGNYSGSDITTFFEAYGMAAYVTPYCIDGSTCPAVDGEAPLDVEYSGAMSNSYGSPYYTARIYEYEMTNNLWSTFEDAYNFVLSDGYAKVVSTSYGGNEDQNSTSAGIETGTMHSILNNMVAAGITLIAASGDQGAAAGCGAATAVQYPSSDPDFLAAGGTELDMNNSGIFLSENAWQGYFYTNAQNNGNGDACGNNYGGSTGGVSKLFFAPSWQTITNSTYPTGVESPYYSWQTVNGTTTEYRESGGNGRLVPDLALTANPGVLGQWFYSGGSWRSYGGGTSIVAPELAGFFAQENSYLDRIGNKCGSGSSACSPVGLASPFIYDAAIYGAPHNPFYDMTSGCNNNDITVANNLFYYCAYAGYDPITGWGSANMMQLAWGINWWIIPAVGTPSLTFTGPATNTWFNTDQVVGWTLQDAGSGGYPAPGALGFTQGWDSIPSDPQTQPHGGDGNSFYTGPEFINPGGGCLSLNGGFGCAGGYQGCHTAYVEGWDNQGRTTTGSYGPVCFDSVAPVSNATLSGTLYGSVYDTAVNVTIASTDATSGVAHTYYSLDGSNYVAYNGTFTVSALGSHSVFYYSTDNAGNSSAAKLVSFTISSLTTTKLTSSANPSTFGQAITFTATVSPSMGGAATGTVSLLHNSTVLVTSTLSGGVAKLVLTQHAAGTEHFSAIYNGSTNDISSTATAVTEVTNKASTTTALSSSSNPSSYGQAITFTATVASAFGGKADGTVTFYHNSTVVGTGTLSNGIAKMVLTDHSVGTEHFTATYAGDGNNTTSTSSALAQVTNKASTTNSLTSSSNPSTYGESITLESKITPAFGGTVSGTVTFNHGSTVLGTATLSGNVAKLTVSNLTVGTSHITAAYPGSGNYVASTSGILSQVVNKSSTTTTVGSSANPSTFGKSVTFTAHVTAATGPRPTGNVAFKDGSTTLGNVSVDSSGNAAFSTSTLAAGLHSITAAYGGSSTDTSSVSAAKSQKVD